MKAKIILAVWLVFAIGFAVATVVLIRRHPVEPPAPPTAKAAEPKSNLDQAKDPMRPDAALPVEPAPTERLSPPTNKAPGESTVKNLSVKRGGPGNNTNTPAAALQPDLEARLNDPVVKEQLGRLALAWVGADYDAEEVWLWTINDPSLSPSARKNLIEDLNEDGFFDPKNPTTEDLPLIENRIALIEELAPDAMDEANADAFLEAYKDLVNMWIRLTQQ
jgi:hypothetical protein